MFAVCEQAWLRVSRAELVVEMTSEALLVLKAKLRHTEYAMAQFMSSSKIVPVSDNSKAGEMTAYYTDKNPSEIAKICQPVADAVECDVNFSSLSSMLSHMDIVCNASLRTFQSLLPEVQSRTYSQRKIILLKILDRYTLWNQNDEPCSAQCTSPSVNNLSRSKDDIGCSTGIEISHTLDETAQSISNEWQQYSAWYTERRYAMLEIEKDFSGFVEDEREKEGRLLRKWLALCDLSTPRSSTVGARANSKSTAGSDAVKSDLSGGSKKTSTNEFHSDSEPNSRSSENICSDPSSRCTSPSITHNDSNSKGSRSSLEESGHPGNVRGVANKGQGQGPGQGHIPQGMQGIQSPPSTDHLQLHSPRCVAAFIEYFCSYYISVPYGLGKCSVLTDALKALVEVRYGTA